MWPWILETLHDHPAIAIFLSLAVGYYVGSFSYKGIGLGSVTATLLAGLAIGQLHIEISPDVQAVFFLMFLFAIGYSVGPQFVRGIAKEGMPQALFALVVSVLCLGTAWLAALAAGYNMGLAAGLFAGASTISSALGLSTDAIMRLGLPSDQTQQMLKAMPTAFAMTYIFGTVGSALILALLGPKLLGTDLVEACQAYEIKMGKKQGKEVVGTAWHQFVLRAYRVTPDMSLTGRLAAEIETSHAGFRLFIERVLRNGEVFDAQGNTRILAGDVIAVAGPPHVLIRLFGHEAEEVEDPKLLDASLEGVDILITSKAIDGKSLAELAQLPATRGVFLTAIRRGATATEIPILPNTRIHRGDVVTVVGRTRDVSTVAVAFGHADRSTDIADVAFIGAAIALGGLVGAAVWHVGAAPLTLSVAGGVLLAGIIFGWLRSIHPTFGRIPPATVWFMNSVGLNVFVAVVGLSTGPAFVAGVQEFGISLFLWGIVVTTVPLILALYIGKYLFRFDDAILLGCCAGARATTAALGMITDRAKSQVPALGYTVTYAVGNTVLTIWGMVIVSLMS